jgi:hypothetical protein
MWLEEFHKNYQTAARKYYDCHLDPASVETELEWARGESLNIASVLRTLGESEHWNYEKWWPAPDSDFGDPLRLPRDLTQEGAQRETVKLLHGRLKNIECVSVILRFLYPDHFGIISFPVTSLLTLPQAQDAVEYYLEYIRNLRELKKLYQSRRLRTVADMDMALWSAAHFVQDSELGPEFESIKKATEEMRQDDVFLDFCFGNLLKGLSSRWKQENSIYLAFGRAFLAQDYRIASVITSKVYESLLAEIGKTYPELRPKRKEGQTDTGALVDAFEDSGIPRKLGIKRGQLDACWKWRIKSVHDSPQPISEPEAQRFTSSISELLGAWQRARTHGSF